MAKKGLFLLIDALRYDVLSDPTARRFLVPNLARLAERGFVRRAIANAQSTQFVVPSLFSLTYPLDYGGYNNGIRERPRSFPETLKEAGFETHMMATCNQLGISLGFDRGFDSVRTTSDYRTLLEQRIERTLRYEIDLWREGQRSEAESIAIIQREFGLLLDGMIAGVARHDKSLWPPTLARINARVAAGCEHEKKLLETEPRAVMAKLTRIAPGVYWRFLGEREPGRARFFYHRLLAAIAWRSRKLIQRQTLWPFLTLSHYPVLIAQVVTALCAFIEAAKDRRWFIHMHTMDVHDCRAINHPWHVVGRLRFFPRWAVARMRGLTRRRWLYDSAAMYADHHLGKLFACLERTGQMDDTVVLVTGDHGSQYAESPREKYAVGFRTYYEDLDVPLLLANAGRADQGQGLIDSMGVTATFLEALGVPLHPSFKGKSAFGPARRVVIAENCGAGNADIRRRDIFFTVTTETHKMMAILRGSNLRVEQLYDLRSDPRETVNIVARPDQQATIADLLSHLRQERAEILALRQVDLAGLAA